jgi:hypothetical protein
MIDIFGPQTPRLFRLLTEMSELRPQDVDAISDAWRRTSAEQRARAWTAIHQAVDPEERIAIQNAALVARHLALAVSREKGLRDSAFWSAAWDAAGALAAAGRNVNDRAYPVLVSAMASAFTWLWETMPTRDIPLQRGVVEEGAWDEPVPTPLGGSRR